MKLPEALAALRKEEKRKFSQSVDLIINLKGIDLKRETVSGVILLPRMISKKRVCGFLESKSALIHTITKPEFEQYKDKKSLKKLVQNYDFFIANAKLMPSVAAAFGKALGPSGKMPSPQLGVVTEESDAIIKNLIEKVQRAIKVRAKEPSIKLSVGKDSMSDETLLANITAAYTGILQLLPSKQENVRSAMIKLTMSAPVRVEGIQ